MKDTVSEYIRPKEAQLIFKSCTNQRDRLILRTMWETGGRVSEVLSLTPKRIDEKDNCIYLVNLKQRTYKEKHKNKNPLKRVFLFEESTLCRDLLRYCAENGIGLNDWVFQGQVRQVGREGQVSPTYIWYLLSYEKKHKDDTRKEGLASQLGIRKMKGSEIKSAWPHLFRHGAAMEILRRTEKLEVVEDQLGHADIGTTEIYAKFTDDQRKYLIDHAQK